MSNNIVKSKSKRAIIQSFLIEEDFAIDFDQPNKEDLIPLVSFIRKSAQEIMEIPRFYRNTGIITFALGLLGVLAGILDFGFGITNLNCSPYIMWSFCCASLYYTNKIALKEWKKKNGKEKDDPRSN